MEKINFRIQIYGSWFLVNFVLCLFPLGVSLIMKNSNTEGIFLSYISYTYTLVIGGYYLYDTTKKSDTNFLLKTFSWLIIVILIAFYCIYPNALINSISNYINKEMLGVSLLALLVIALLYLMLSCGELERRVEKEYTDAMMNKSKKVTKNYQQTLQEVRDEL